MLDFADEQSVVQTRFATTALSLLRAHDRLRPRRVVADAERRARRAAAGRAASRPTLFDFLGRGWTVGLASEAALKLREAAQAWTEAYPAMEYRHGPISIAGPGAGSGCSAPRREASLDDVPAAGATGSRRDLDPLAALVLAQRTGVALAEAAGARPDRPRNLTRSVVLFGGAAVIRIRLVLARRPSSSWRSQAAAGAAEATTEKAAASPRSRCGTGRTTSPARSSASCRRLQQARTRHQGQRHDRRRGRPRCARR